MSHETNSFFKTEYKRHPNITDSNVCGFGKTITIKISRTGVGIEDSTDRTSVRCEMTECFKCGKTHRAFVHPDNYYNGTTCECDGCCPVIRINLPAITRAPQIITEPVPDFGRKKISTGKASKKHRHKKRR